MNKNRQATKEFDKEDKEEQRGRSLIAVSVKDNCKQELAGQKRDSQQPLGRAFIISKNGPHVPYIQVTQPNFNHPIWDLFLTFEMQASLDITVHFPNQFLTPSSC